MNQDRNVTPLPAYAKKSLARRLPLLLASVLVSTGVLSSVLGLFEMQSRDGTLAKASPSVAPANPLVAKASLRTSRVARS